jgi:two-component system sensor histidine kinase RpfC
MGGSVRFWRLLISGRLRAAWHLLARRPDTEHEQAIIRVALTGLIFIYLCWSLRADQVLDPGEHLLLWTSGLYHLVSWGLFLYILKYPEKSPVRRYIGAVGDLSLTSYGIYLGGESAAPLYVVLLWVIFGNGFRYGRKYLFVSTVIGTLGFGAATRWNPYWRDKLTLAIGLQVGIVMLPLYVSSLLKKLTVAIKKAEDANQAKNRFLANMSHEMRTPLSGIIGLMDLLKGTPLTADQEELVNTADASSRTLLFLMQDVLDLSKIEAGKVSVQISDFDLHELVKNTLPILEPQALDKGLNLYLHVSADVPFLLRGDPLLLRQVLLNLLGNAVKFTERGEVGLRVSLESESPRDASLRFDVVDTGIGIAPEAQHRIFERFSQADDSITRRYGGTGLGTTIAKEIIEVLGGQIGLNSIPGQGSTFWFTIQMDKQQASQPDGSAAVALTGKRALVVSADPALLGAVKVPLETWGVRAVVVDRAAQAFAQMVSAANVAVPFDFVVVDKTGLDMEAAGFARAVKSDPTIHQARLLLVADDKEERLEAAKSGYSAVLPASVDRALLFNALHLSLSDSASADASSNHFAERRTHQRPQRRTLRILLAEDNVTNQMVTSRILENAGHEVVVVGDGEKALDALKSQSFDITLMDLHMPVMGGIEAAKLYRFMNREARRMPIVALTADATLEAQAECEEAGIDACLTKPIDKQRLFQLLQELVPHAADHQGSGQGDSMAGRSLAAAPAAAESSCLDQEVLHDLAQLGGRQDFLVRVVWAFLKGGKEKIRELEKGVAAGDVELVREVAHALKGNSGQIGAVALMRACELFSGISAAQLERSGRQYFESVREEFSRARAALDQYVRARNSAVS